MPPTYRVKLGPTELQSTERGGGIAARSGAQRRWQTT